MQEDFLHHVWKFQKFSKTDLKTTDGALVTIVKQGEYNHHSGPDFFTAQIKIGTQLWAGNVEIHLKSSDWYAHRHEEDAAYDNVILHVVWEHDTDVFQKDNKPLPTLVLKDRVFPEVFQAYKNLFSKTKKWIPCENDFASIDDFVLQNWMERLYVERLESKTEMVFQLLEKSKNDWEAVLFQLLAKNFGLKVNGEAFLRMAASFDFSVVRKIGNKQEDLEALFFGQAFLLEDEIDVVYYKELQNRYAYLRTKFRMQNTDTLPVQFFRLRPDNFPTIRLAQLAALYAKEQQLFSKIIAIKSKEGFRELFDVETAPFWDTNYLFTTESKFRKKKISNAFLDLLLINTVALVKFCYVKSLGNDAGEEIMTLLSTLPKEENSIIKNFNKLRKNTAENALQSQALLELKNNYCANYRCLSCAIGNQLLIK
jgi:hypothetical protein